MSATIIDGKAAAEKVRAGLAERVLRLKQKGIVPGLAVILVGDNPASQIYVRNKARACENTGIHSRVERMPENTTQEQLHAMIREINGDPAIHALLVQLPLPGHLNEAEALRQILPAKDADGFTLANAGALLTGTKGVLPCTPRGIIELLKGAGVPLQGAHAAVIGRSNIVGKPTALLLLRENATVTVCHSRTRDLASVVSKADIVVAAVGRPGFVTADMIKPGAAVIDVGINRLGDGRLAGDVDFDRVRETAGWITPVPGGVGPVTIAMLLANAVEAAEAYAR
ncbi:MAG: bifunctional methylenetetrahydrofolate dehydrogenase/methenyltetrahydrofolate cyclohydrolase [Clostridia bacterium]|nr:bifunctional methylenetetrahydrofolate dehydrogenase/methenyltetrahydrofolate cyclohydrolase [Clostridia bacterium]